MEINWRAVNAECGQLTPEQDTLAREVKTRIAETWTLFTMATLAEAAAPMRFSRLMEKVEGVSQKSLTKTLRQLEGDGLVTRMVFPEVPPRVEYTITALGTTMLAQIHPLWIWTIENLDKFEQARRRYDKKSAA
ncbi:winged helix-turn-helix transcriptional regulator [Burkholderia cepacia]|uniref:winged helix-turn-helix transcriptional regulator n=1 Tax=Burkholderia cepacia TaxID=292 RepID=UPI001589DF52|nr:helix-turn-helix domain-containing protein [Burkholderia cepacia]